MAKDRALKASKDGMLIIVIIKHFFVQFSIKILEKTSSHINIASEFLDFLLQYRDNNLFGKANLYLTKADSIFLQLFTS